MALIVKRKGHKEIYDERKVYASVFAACMTLRMADEEAETIAHMVTGDVEQEIKGKDEVTSTAIQTAAAKSLKKYHPDAAYMYSTHKDLS